MKLPSFLILVVFVYILCLQVLSANNKGKMLIFISPEYSESKELRRAIEGYAKSVKKRGPGWTTKIIVLNKDLPNNKKAIDRKIENEYGVSKGLLKAAIVVGEDTDSYRERHDQYILPNTSQWEDTRGSRGGLNREFNKNGEYWDVWSRRWKPIPDNIEITYRYKPEVAISLIYQNISLKKSERFKRAINAFNKFSKRQGKIISGPSIAITDTELAYKNVNEGIKANLKSLDMFHEIVRDPGRGPELSEKKRGVIFKPCAVLGAFAHGSPRGIYQNLPLFSRPLFECKDFKRINTPFVMLEGCHTQSWVIAETEGKKALLPVFEFLGEGIFKNPKTYSILAGVQRNVDAHRKVIEDLERGKTLAEAIVGKKQSSGARALFGDPTLQISIIRKKNK